MDYRDDREVIRVRLAEAEERARRAEEELERTRAGHPTKTGLASDTLFTLTKVALWLQFAAWVGLVLVSVPVYISIAHKEPPFGSTMSPVIQGCMMAFLVDVFLAPAGILPLIALRGVSKGRRWAWGVTLASGIAGSLCFCVPLGALTLASVLRSNVRQALIGA
ncbi:MAG TPA: hypothetical protein VM925_31135 [Labilithrix sp.]|nr:hypothetical protein [Labilithrix sp.]